MKNFLMMACGLIIAIGISGCGLFSIIKPDPDPNGPITLTDGVGKKIAIDVEILDEFETYHWPWKILPWRGKAELYLKIYDQKNPKIL